MPTKLAPFVEALDKALRADGHRPKHERRTARAMYEEIKAAGYDGGCSRVPDFIPCLTPWRRRRRGGTGLRAAELRAG